MVTRRASKRIPLVAAMALEWLGLLCVVYFAGNALLTVVVDVRFSDVVADTMPLALAGGLGFTITWSIASLTRRLAQTANPASSQSGSAASGHEAHTG